MVSLLSLLTDDIAMEAARDELKRVAKIASKVTNPDTAMAVDLITDKVIMNSNLKPVTDPIAFSNGGIPTDGGLFSETIFGRTIEYKQRQYAYIDLVETFFHPFVYETLKILMPKRFEKCASAQGAWEINKAGELVELKKTDPGYNEDNTGIQWLIKNYDRMSFKMNDSIIRQDRVNMLRSLTKSEIFITKFPVIPIIYRDVGKDGGTHKLPEINNNYNNIIRYANSLRDSTFAFFNNQVRFNLQQELVNIRKYGQTLLEKKTGFIHRSILGKSIDRGSRDVISVPSFLYQQRPEDNPVDILHTGVPLSKCLILGFNFVMRFCTQFFSDNFRNVTEYPVYKKNPDGTYTISGSISIKDPALRFTPSYIEKKINRFKNSHGTRFEPVTIESENGSEIPLFVSIENPVYPNVKDIASAMSTRPMTWTDLFYIAAEEMLSDKYVYITRYPITSYNSIFPSKCRVMSTIKTAKAIVNGKEYQFYPVIDLNTPTDRISNQFIDTITMSNLYLSALGGDYDGDQTSQKLCYTIEANAEAERVAQSVRNFVTPDGKLLRVVGNEAYLTFFNMTRDVPPGPMVSAEDKKFLISIKKEDLTINNIAKWFGASLTLTENRRDAFKTLRKARFNVCSKMILEAGESCNKTKVETTVGKYLFNRLMVDGYIDTLVPNGYYNEVVNKSKFSKLSSMVAAAIINRTISIPDVVVPWVNAYEFWGLCLVTIFAPSYSPETIIPNPELKKYKEKLLSEAKDKSLNTLSTIESKLIQEADRLTSNTPGKWLFDSGARGSFSNDFKNMAISVGVVENPITGEFDFMESNYMDGIKKEDLPAAANIVINAEYPKAIKTAEGGYLSKKLFSMNQSIIVDDPGTDCGTKYGITVIITKNNLSDYIDQYLIDGNKLVLIDEKLPETYMNHKVMVRSPMYCLSKTAHCSRCAGARFYKIGIKNIGLTSAAMSGSLQNATLKLRHNLSINVDVINENEILI